MPESGRADEAPSGADVTVVIATRDRADLLARALRSVHAQTVRPSRIVVAEAGGRTAATATTVERARRDGIPVDHLAAPAGAGAARNVALAAVTTPLVAPLDDDDSWHPEFLAACLTALGRHDPQRMAITHTELRTPDGPRIHRVRAVTPRVALTRHTGVGGGNALVPTAALRAVGGYDEGLRALLDADLGLRLLRHGVEPVVVPRALAVADQAHGRPRISTSDAHADGQVDFFRKWVRAAPPAEWPRMGARMLIGQRRSSARWRRAVGEIVLLAHRAHHGTRRRLAARRQKVATSSGNGEVATSSPTRRNSES